MEEQKMSTRYWGLAALLLLFAGPAKAEHLWTDATGQYTAEAALVDYDGETVVLKNVSGKLISLPMEKLSEKRPGVSENAGIIHVGPAAHERESRLDAPRRHAD